MFPGVAQRSFEDLVNQHKDAVYGQMLRVCGHREDAEDALATAMLHAFKAYQQLESDEAFRAWLSTIARRVCTRMRGHRGIDHVVEFAEHHGLVDESVSEFDIAVLKGCVQEAIDSMPLIYREIYTACELDEVTIADAAKQIGISVGAAKSRLLRARAFVRQALDQSICAR